MVSYSCIFCSMSLFCQAARLYVGGTFRDDTIIGWARKELVPDAAVLPCHATLFPVAWRDKKKLLWWGAIDWQCFSKVICCGSKIYHYSFRGTHSLLGYHEYHQTAVHFFKSLNWLCSQSKLLDIIFHLKKKKKKNAKEVIFPVKYFRKSLIKSCLKHDSFCSLTLWGKTSLETFIKIEYAQYI